MTDAHAEPVASIILVTHNRLRMLEKCVSSLLESTDGVPFEVIVWDNASDDGTREYLDQVAEASTVVDVIHSSVNIGVNAVAEGVKAAKGFYLVEIDDDVLSFPQGWLQKMIAAFDRVPFAGYLAANVVQDECTDGAKPPAGQYQVVDYGGGVVIEHGPAGGWCTITSKAVIARIGNFAQAPGRIFFAEDGDFVARCLRRGLRVGIVRDVVVYHATGVKANKEHGYLNVCELKYSDDPAYRPWLEATRKEMRRG